MKNPPANAGDTGDTSLIPGSGRSPRGGNSNPSSILTCTIPRTKKPGGLQFIGSQRAGHCWVIEHAQEEMRIENW